MKPVLALKLGQQLRMTPQLQQAIKLLQLSTFDLQQEIQEALDSNLMLEEASESDNSEEPTSLDTPEETIEGEAKASEAEAGTTEQTEANTTEVNSDGEPDFSDEPAPANPEIDGDVIPDTSDQLASDNIADELPVDSLREQLAFQALMASKAEARLLETSVHS